MLFRLVSSTLLLSSLLATAAAGTRTATHEIVQFGDQSLVAVELKNETLKLDAAAAAKPTEEFDEKEEDEYDEDYDEEEEDEYDEEDQTAEAYSNTVASPAVRVCRDENAPGQGHPCQAKECDTSGG